MSNVKILVVGACLGGIVGGVLAAMEMPKTATLIAAGLVTLLSIVAMDRMRRR